MATATKTTFARRFKDKQLLKLVSVTRDCPLSFEERTVYSYLVKAARGGHGYRPSVLAADSGIEEGHTVPKCREKLVSLGLARVEEGVIYAVEPTEMTRKWFHFFDEKSADDSVWSLFRNYPIPLREVGCRLTPRQVALLGLLYSFAKGKDQAKGLRLTALSTMLGCSRQTVHTAMNRLKLFHLVDPYQSRTDQDKYAIKLPVPTDEAMAWFRDRSDVRDQLDEEYPGFTTEECDEDEVEVIEPHVARKPADPVFVAKPIAVKVDVDENESKDEDILEDYPDLAKSMITAGYTEGQARECLELASEADLSERQFRKMFASCQ